MLGTRGRASRVAVRPEAAHWALPPLLLPLVLAVADRLPADDKLRLAFVSPAFRAVADERWLYRDVRLGSGSGVGRASDVLLRAVAAKARGTMRTLDVSGLLGGPMLGAPVVSVDAVVAVCAANDTLQAVDARCKDELDDWQGLGYDDVVRLLASVPRLVRLDADVSATTAQLRVLLRNPSVRVQRLIVQRFHDNDDVASFVALVAALGAHPSVTQLGLVGAPLGAAVALDAVVDFAVQRRLSALHFCGCALNAVSMPALTRLLEQGTGLVSLAIQTNSLRLPVSAAFCAALRTCTLTRLELAWCHLFDDPSGLALLAAATAHPVLQQLNVSCNVVAEDARPAVGAALGALVGANARALTSLDVLRCNLGDEGLRPLVDALPGNAALRRLDIIGNNVTPLFGAALLAAVRINTSLRTLAAGNRVFVNGGWLMRGPVLAEADALVAARA